MITPTSYTVPLEFVEEAKNSIYDDDFRIVLNEPTNRFFYDPWKITDTFKNTIWEKILNTLPGNIGEARIVKLKHGTCYMSHCDIDDRFHLGIDGQYSYLIDIDSKQMHEILPDGIWSEMNTGVRHVAANFGSITRTQIVVRKLLNDADLISPVKIKIQPVCENPRFEFDNEVSPVLNFANKKKIISDFEILDDGVSFFIENLYLEFVTKKLSKKMKVQIL